MSYDLANTTKIFIQKKANFDVCIFNATGVSPNISNRSECTFSPLLQQLIPIIPLDLNVTQNTSVCTLCSRSYNDMNDFFLQISQGNNQEVCMDIIDTVRKKAFLPILCYFICLLDELHSIIME